MLKFPAQKSGNMYQSPYDRGLRTYPDHMKRKSQTASELAFLLLLVFLCSPLWPSMDTDNLKRSKLTAGDIMAEYHTQRNSRNERSRLTMKLMDSRYRERSRKLEQITITDSDGNQKMLIIVQEPEDIRGTAFLIVEHSQSDNDQWLYLPALRRVRRVLPNEKSDSFLGSDFSYTDLETENLDHYKYRLLGEDSLDGNHCWIIEARPADEKTLQETGYGKRELWIRSDNFVGLQTRFFDKKERPVKLFRALNVSAVNHSQKWRAYRLEMKNLESGHRTIILYENFIIDQGVPDWIFTRAYLERRK